MAVAGSEMIENSTVFVLGAGASWHYGYPTGDDLVEHVKLVASKFSNYCRHRLISSQVDESMPRYVEQRVYSNRGAQAAIEAWIHRPDWISPIGRLMIAAAILECEAAKGYRTPVSWHRFIVHKLVYGCTKSADLLRNDVHFITFNYDASLEYHLYSALTSLDIIEPAHARQFLVDERIVHTYGCVHPDIPFDQDFVNVTVARGLGEQFFQPIDRLREFESRKLFLDRCLKAAENLKTIDPHDKEEDQELLTRARTWIENANVIYILGYGFDANNNRRIGLPLAANGSNKIVMFTNFGDLNTINKKTSKLFFGDLVHFSDQVPRGDPKASYFEKSIHSVYEALEKDFDALEGELTSSTKI
jgi:hypothetical protein